MTRLLAWLGAFPFLGLVTAGPAGAQAPPAPAVTLRLGGADAGGIPDRDCCSKTGGGNFDVRQTAPDTIVVTLTAVAVAGGNPFCDSNAHFNLDLLQKFTVVFERPEVKAATLTIQGRVVGLLRSPCKGSAGTSEACAAVTCDPLPGNSEAAGVASFCLPARQVGPKENLSVYLRGEPVCVPVGPGCYTLRQTFAVHATRPKGGFPGKETSAEFAPAPALNPAWISYKEPFNGAAKRDFGFQVIVKVAPAPEAVAMPVLMPVGPPAVLPPKVEQLPPAAAPGRKQQGQGMAPRSSGALIRTTVSGWLFRS